MPGAMPFRAFVAVDVGPRPSLVRRLDALRATGADLKVVPPGNLHVTLKFLGWVEDDRVPACVDAIRAAVAGERPFAMRVRGAGQFPPRGAGRVWWTDLEGAEPLARMAARLEDGFERLGFPREARPFAPHLTLARARSSAGADRAARAMAAVPVDEEVRVADVVLYRSDLARSGPTYTPVARVPLEG